MTDGAGAETATSTGARRPWWRYLLWFAGAIVIVAVVAIALGFGLTSGVAKAGDAWLATLSRQGPAAAYEAAAPQFRAVAPVAQWDAFARASGLAANTGASWSSRETNNDAGSLKGTVKTPSGSGPIALRLVKDASGWRVASLEYRGGQSSAAATTAAVTAAGGTVQNDAATATGVVGGAPTGGAAAAPLAQPRPGYPSPGLDSVSVPPPAAAGSLLGARTSGDGLTPGMSTVPAAKVAGICMTMMQAERLPITGVECPQGLVTTPGAATRCVVRSGGGQVGMTVTLRSYDPASTRPTLMCVVDNAPLSRP